MHADLFMSMAEQLRAEAAHARDAAERAQLLAEAAEWRALALRAARGEWISWTPPSSASARPPRR